MSSFLSVTSYLFSVVGTANYIGNKNGGGKQDDFSPI